MESPWLTETGHYSLLDLQEALYAKDLCLILSEKISIDLGWSRMAARELTNSGTASAATCLRTFTEIGPQVCVSSYMTSVSKMCWQLWWRDREKSRPLEDMAAGEERLVTQSQAFKDRKQGALRQIVCNGGKTSYMWVLRPPAFKRWFWVSCGAQWK